MTEQQLRYPNSEVLKRYSKEGGHQHGSTIAKKLSPHAKELVKNLGNLKDGWSGEESIAPNEVIINKLKEILFALELDEKDMPSVQIDEDGTITVFWDVDEEIQCSIDILRNGKTVCIYTRIGENSSESRVVKTTKDEDFLNFCNTSRLIRQLEVSQNTRI